MTCKTLKSENIFMCVFVSIERERRAKRGRTEREIEREVGKG